MTKELYMERCFALAQKGLGNVSPNPMVGAVLVYQDTIIGEGYHAYFGGPHAEINCLHSVKPEHHHLVKEATLYVSLEPCCHYGKTPPCSLAIIEHQIPKVMIACLDSHSLVKGKGIAQLQEAGIEVELGILEKQAQELNKRFFTYHLKKRPYMILKWAETEDGYIGQHRERIGLTNALSNKLVHTWRSEEDAIWVGYRTVMIDNPLLTVRHVSGKNPIRVVYDKDATLPSSSLIFNQEAETLYFTSSANRPLSLQGSIQVDSSEWLRDILNHLYQRGISSVLVEGGGALLQTCIDQDLWDEARIFRTPITLNQGVKAPILPIPPNTPSQRIGSDLCFTLIRSTH